MVRFKTGDIGYFKDTQEKVIIHLYSIDSYQTHTLSKLSVSYKGDIIIVDQDELFTQQEYRNFKIEQLLNEQTH